jgi:hypothetical protein
VLFEQAKVDVRPTQPLKRESGINIETCTGCGGKLRVIARMLTHP